MTGRLHTCYSPVRRSPAVKASFNPDAPRLACVRPVASVHPEPGSNSPLLYFNFFSFFFFIWLGSTFVYQIFFHPEQVLFLLDEFPLFLQSCFPCAYCLSLSQLFQCSLYLYALKSQHSLAFPLKSECKINTFFQTTKIFLRKNLKFFYLKNTNQSLTNYISTQKHKSKKIFF